MNSKAQGLSLNTMVIAAVVLVVLIVIIGVFTGYFGNFVSDFTKAGEQSCSASETRPASQGCNDDETRFFGNFGEDWDDRNICCKLKDPKADCIEECETDKNFCYVNCEEGAYGAECYDDCDATFNARIPPV